MLSMQSTGDFVANRDHTSMPRNPLTKASLDLHENQEGKAWQNLSKAKIRLKEMGCHRWDREVEDLEELF
jgi:hypothetical protein